MIDPLHPSHALLFAVNRIYFKLLQVITIAVPFLKDYTQFYTLHLNSRLVSQQTTHVWGLTCAICPLSGIPTRFYFPISNLEINYKQKNYILTAGKHKKQHCGGKTPTEHLS